MSRRAPTVDAARSDRITEARSISRRAAFLVAMLALGVALSPATAGSGPPVIPPPPPWFDPGMVRIVTGAYGHPSHFDEGLYESGVDGSDPRLIVPNARHATLAAGGVVVVAVPVGEERLVLRLVRPDGTSADVLEGSWLAWTPDPDRDRALVSRSGAASDGQRDALVALDVEGGSIREVVPGSLLGPAYASPDERWLAWQEGAGEVVGSYVRYQGPDGRVRSLVRGEPIGWDVLGRLWYRPFGPNGAPSLARFDPASGRTRVYRRLHWRDILALVTPDGRNLVTMNTRGDGVNVLVIADQADGDRWRVRMPPGDLLDAMSRYLVFDTEQAGVRGTIVVDLLEHWVGFVPWRGLSDQ